MVATLSAAQRNGSTTLEVIMINCAYQLLWLKMVANRETQSNHQDMLQSPTLVVGEKKGSKLDSSSKVCLRWELSPMINRSGWLE